jgi:alpha-tubulin suppressor-like RCC1 family protein
LAALGIAIGGCGKTRAKPPAVAAGGSGGAAGEAAAAAGMPVSGGAGGDIGALLEAGASCLFDAECASGSCSGGTCCAESCGVCQSCTGEGFTCVDLGLREEDYEPEGACSGDRWCTEGARCEQKAQVVVGSSHTCVLTAEGNVRCWGIPGVLGYGGAETIGDNEAPSSAGYVDVGGKVVELAAKMHGTCALLEQGNVRCWGAEGPWHGYEREDAIGDDETPASAGDVALGGKAIHLVAAHLHTCALIEGGRVRCWGEGDNGGLGYPQKLIVSDPATAGDVDVGAPALALSAGRHSTCAILAGGALRCWGYNLYGQLGYPHQDDVGWAEPPSAAGDAATGGPIAQSAAGMNHGCGLLQNGDVRCWGNSVSFSWVVPPAGAPPTPVGALVDFGFEVMSIAAAEHRVCAVGRQGGVRCLGNGQPGVLGYPGQLEIGDDPGETPASLGDIDIGAPVEELAIGPQHSCALLADARIRCWGMGIDGALGYGNTQDIGDDEPPSMAGDVPYQ